MLVFLFLTNLTKLRSQFMNPSNLLLGLLAAAGLSLFFPNVRQAFRIRINSAASNSTSAVERLDDRRSQLEDKLPRLRQQVAEAVGKVKTAEGTLKNLQDKLAGLKQDYATANGENDEDAKNYILEQIGTLNTQIAAQEKSLTTLKQISTQQLESYEAVKADLKEFSTQILIAEQQAGLAGALRTANAFKDELNSYKDGLGGAARDLEKVENDLNSALADADLVQGSDGEKAHAQIQRKRKVDETRKALEAELGISSSPSDSETAG
jgi:chromosome segregation ATPase